MRGIMWKTFVPSVVLLLATGAPVWGASATYSAPSMTAAVVDAETGKPVRSAVMSVAWVMRPARSGPHAKKPRSARLLVEQAFIRYGQVGFPAWKQPRVAGWELQPGQDPLVRVYAQGYRRLVVENTVRNQAGKTVPFNPPDAKERKWAADGTTLRMEKLPDTKEAFVRELKGWRKDIETEINAHSVLERRQSAIASQRRLLMLFWMSCMQIEKAAQVGLCFETDSELGPKSDAAFIEQDGEIREIKVVKTRTEVQHAPFIVKTPTGTPLIQEPTPQGGGAPAEQTR